MTFWIIVFVILGTAFVILILSICKVSGDADRAMAAHMAEIERANVAGREKWEAKLAPYFNDGLGIFEEDE